MIYFGLGIVGFGLLLIFDIFSLNEKSVVKYLFAILGFGLIIGSTILLLTLKSNIQFPSFLRIVSLIGAVFFLALLIYSVFIEVGKNTYQYKNESKLVTTGTYALSRHPGVLWFLLVYMLAAVSFQNHYILVAGLIWTGINIIYVVIQERFIFTKLFKHYGKYVETTPMLLPSRDSIEKCITTLKWRKE